MPSRSPYRRIWKRFDECKAMIGKLVSGGQTGADIASLDVARRPGFPHGGWCPKARRSEAGPIPDYYELEETPTANYLRKAETRTSKRAAGIR